MPKLCIKTSVAPVEVKDIHVFASLAHMASILHLHFVHVHKRLHAFAQTFKIWVNYFSEGQRESVSKPGLKFKFLPPCPTLR